VYLAFHPEPPRLVMPDAQWWFTAWLGLPLTVVLVIAVRQMLRGRGPLLLYCVLGGALSCIFEAIVNLLGGMIYAEDGIWTAYSTFGRQIPWLIPLAYSWFMGGQAYYCYRRFERGISRRDVFRMWAVFCVIDAVIETPGLLAGVYTYYGEQPWNFWGFPFWYAWANSLTPVVAGAVIFKLREYHTGWKQLSVIILIPMAEGLSYAATCWPVWSTLNTHLGYRATYPASLLNLALTLYLLWMVTVAVSPRPASDRQAALHTS
jgi:hypothetical protein